MILTVSDFTEVERDLVAELLQQRYNKKVLPEIADCELKLDPSSGATAVDGLTRELGLEQVFGFVPGTTFACKSS